MRTRNTLITLSFAAILLSGTAMAAAYKWTDSQGNVHYSQERPSEDEVAVTVENIAPPVPVPTPAQGQGLPGEANEEEVSDTPEATSEFNPEHQAEIYRKNCETAMKNMEVYRTSRRIRDTKGEVIRLSKEMREEKLKEAQQAIDKYCK